MNPFNEKLEYSESINRWSMVERMDQNDIYEFWLECYCAYRDMFLLRIHSGSYLKQMLKFYKQIPQFLVMHPSEMEIIFSSAKMAIWFSILFEKAIASQVNSGNIDREKLIAELTSDFKIPTQRIMEDICNDFTKTATNKLLFERQTFKTEATEA